MNDEPEFPAEDSEPRAPEKRDPETVVLRGRPSPVIRFKRGLIIGICAVGSAAIIGVTYVALQPAGLKLLADSQSQLGVDRKQPPEALAGAPSSYADIPKLGPPMPGDLGRPILAAQRKMATEGEPTNVGVDQAAQAAEAERQRLLAEQRKVREADVMMGLTQQPSSTVNASTNAVAPDGNGTAPRSADAKAGLALDPEHDPNAQGNKIAFAGTKSADEVINPHRIQNATSPYTLSAGSVIAGSLITGLNSDLPGLVTAQVTENVYDSPTGRILLLPQGARLIGSYDSVVAFGQSRALLVWQRIIMPDGSSIQIDNAPATDASGYAGLADKVDRHTWQLIKGVALSTLLGVGTELTFGGNESDLVRALRESTQQNASQAGQQLAGKSIGIQPTIKVRPGWPLRIVVHKDLVLRPWNGGQ
jgi:type IV secretion system protein TrbI